jgi:PAS domain S-box-containing protein
MAPSRRPGIPIELQQQALEAAQLMVREFDGTILHWTRGMERLYGWAPEEAVGRKSHQLLQTIFPRPLADIEAELIDEGEWTGELIHMRRDGERLVAASHWSLSTPIVVEVYNDVTAERRGHEARQYLATIVESSADAIIGKTTDGIITSWNPGAELMFGYTADEIIGKSITMLFPPDRLNEEFALIEKIKRGERVDHFETQRRRKDGKFIPVSLTISPIIGADGQIIGASKIVHDDSERHRAQVRLHDLQSELFHLSRLNTVNHMASALAHELNQPLAAIVNYLRGVQRLLADRTDDLPQRSSTLWLAPASKPCAPL